MSNVYIVPTTLPSLTVTGTTSLNGAVTTQSTAVVGGNLLENGSLTVTGALVVGGATSLQGTTAASLTVTGTAIITNASFTGNGTSSITASSDIYINGLNGSIANSAYLRLNGSVLNGIVMGTNSELVYGGNGQIQSNGGTFNWSILGNQNNAWAIADNSANNYININCVNPVIALQKPLIYQVSVTTLSSSYTVSKFSATDTYAHLGDSGKVFTNSASVTISLPVSAVGLNYSFANAFGTMSIQAIGSDKIYSVATAGTALASAAAGTMISSVTGGQASLICTATNVWMANCLGTVGTSASTWNIN